MTLKPLEKELLVGVSEGLTIKEQAIATKMKPSTVDTYLVRLRGKVGARNSAHLITIAFRNGILQ